MHASRYGALNTAHTPTVDLEYLGAARTRSYFAIHTRGAARAYSSRHYLDGTRSAERSGGKSHTYVCGVAHTHPSSHERHLRPHTRSERLLLPCTRPAAFANEVKSQGYTQKGTRGGRCTPADTGPSTPRTLRLSIWSISGPRARAPTSPSTLAAPHARTPPGTISTEPDRQSVVEGNRTHTSVGWRTHTPAPTNGTSDRTPAASASCSHVPGRPLSRTKLKARDIPKKVHGGGDARQQIRGPQHRAHSDCRSGVSRGRAHALLLRHPHSRRRTRVLLQALSRRN